MAVNKPTSLRGSFADIWRYTVSEWSIEQAHHYVDKLDEAFLQFVQNHYLMRDARHSRQGSYAFPCGRHMLCGKLKGDVLITIRMLHERMDHSRWL